MEVKNGWKYCMLITYPSATADGIDPIQAQQLQQQKFPDIHVV